MIWMKAAAAQQCARSYIRLAAGLCFRYEPVSTEMSLVKLDADLCEGAFPLHFEVKKKCVEVIDIDHDHLHIINNSPDPMQEFLRDLQHGADSK